MIEAALWGWVGGAALLLGAAAGVWLPVSTKVVGLIMGFGTGVLFSAVAFELTQEAFSRSGTLAVVLGLMGGALTYFAGDWFLDNRGGHRRKNPEGMHPDAGPMALVLGALLDGIPESAAIGISLVGGSGVGVAVLAAVFLSNVPEALSASAGMRASGVSTSRIFAIWGAVTLASTVAAGAGFSLLGDADPIVVATTQAFAAGAILTMLSDTMVPEAVKYAGRWVGLVTVVGFGSAFLLSALG